MFSSFGSVKSCFFSATLQTKHRIGILLSAVMLSACIKLEERNIKLVTDCEKCIRMIEDSLSKEQGVYWINFQQQTKQLTIKYDTSLISGQELYLFLAKKGLVRTTKDVPLQPACCQ
jgi:hypothetical protein